MKKWIGLLLSALVIFSVLYIFSNSLKSESTVDQAKDKVEEVVETVVETVTRHEVSIGKAGRVTIAKMGHMLEFCAFSLLFAFTYFFLGGFGDSSAFYRLMFTCTFVALTDEHLQTLDATRSSRVTDVLIDLSACMLGYAIARGIYALIERRRSRGDRVSQS